MEIVKGRSRPGLTVTREKVDDMQTAVSTGRSNYIGGSDAGVIFGFNPWKSRYRLWCEKTGRISDEIPDNDAMRTGRDLEEYVAKRFEDATGKAVQKSNYKYSLKEYPFMAGHIDRMVVGENAVLECKTANSYQDKDYANGVFPDHYYAQCQHYMAVTGCDKVYLGVLCFPHFYMKEYDRNEAEIEVLINAESEFWSMVENDSPPEMDGSESTTEAVQMEYPESMKGTSIALSGTEDSILDQIEKIEMTIKDLEKQKEECKNNIKAYLGNSETGSSMNWEVTWKTQTARRIDSKMLKKEEPGIYDRYSKETRNRVFRSKRINDRS